MIHRIYICSRNYYSFHDWNTHLLESMHVFILFVIKINAKILLRHRQQKNNFSVYFEILLKLLMKITKLNRSHYFQCILNASIKFKIFFAFCFNTLRHCVQWVRLCMPAAFWGIGRFLCNDAYIPDYRKVISEFLHKIILLYDRSEHHSKLKVVYTFSICVSGNLENIYNLA